jgi:hypothetical protein
MSIRPLLVGCEKATPPSPAVTRTPKMALLQAALRREEPRDRRRKRDEVWIRWTPRRVGRGVGLQVGGDRSRRERGQADRPSKGS